MQVQTEKKKITFSCPQCKATLKVPLQLAGVSGPCPKCGGSITAPRPGSKQQSVPSRSHEPASTSKVLPESPAPSPIRQIPVVPAALPVQRMSAAADATSQQRPPRVEIEDLNESPIAKVPPVEIEGLNESPTEKAPPVENISFPQSFQKASKEEETTESFDDIKPASSVVRSKPVPEVVKRSLAPLPIQKKEVGSISSEPVEIRSNLSAAPISPLAKEDKEPSPVQRPAQDQPRVTVSTIPAPSTSQVSGKQPVAVKSSSISGAQGVSVPRIKRDGRREAKNEEVGVRQQTETRPITPVTNPGIKGKSNAEVSTVESTMPPAEGGAQSFNELPRLDVSLANKGIGDGEQGQVNLPTRNAAATKPSGPTRINLPQLNALGASEASNRSPNQQPTHPQEKAAPQPQPQPISAPQPDHREIPLQVDPSAVLPLQERVPSPAPAPAEIPVVKNSGPLDSLPSPRQEEVVAEAKPETDRGISGPNFSNPLPASRQDRALEKSQVTDDRGLGSVILDKSSEPRMSEFSDELFDAPQGSPAKRRKLGILQGAVIGGVIIATFAIVVVIGKAFGVFPGADTNPENDESNNPVAVVEEKPAVERPEEKQAVEKPTGIVEFTDPAVLEPTDPILGGGSAVATIGEASDNEGDTVSLPPIGIDTPPTEVASDNSDIPDRIKETIEAARDAIEPVPGSVTTGAAVSPAPAAATTTATDVVEAVSSTAVPSGFPAAITENLDGIDALTETPVSNTPNIFTEGAEPLMAVEAPRNGSASSAGLQPNPLKATASGATGEFSAAAAPPASAIAGPPMPAPGTFTPPSGERNDRLGSARELVETFLSAPFWKDQIPYTYKAADMESQMTQYYSQWPYDPLPRVALKFQAMETDPKFKGPYWVYQVTTSNDSDGFPVFVRKENDLLKIDWRLQVEFRDEHFAKFLNGEIRGKLAFRLFISQLSGYYGSDAEGFKNLDDYYVFKVNPPYGETSYEQTVFVRKDSPVGASLAKLVPVAPLGAPDIGGSPVIVELDNQTFPHKINHLVITKFITDGWFTN